MSNIIRFVWKDDETCEIRQGKHLIFTAEHGPHGWDGMEGILNAFRAFADLNGYTIEVLGEPGI